MPPITSAGQCIFASTRPTQVRDIAINIKTSRMIRVAFDFIYLGRIKVVRKKIVATTITWVEGKDGSPEPLGRVLTINNLSNTK